MSGFEIVGVVLGSLPLILELYDRSGKVFEACSTFKHSISAIELYRVQMQTQRCLFKNCYAQLMKALSDNKSKVEELLNEPPACAKSERLDRFGLEESLHDLLQNCSMVVNRISRELEPLCVQLESLVEELRHQQDTTGIETVTKFMTKLKISLGVSKRNSTIAKLRSLVQDFAAIGKGIRQTLDRLSGTNNDVQSAARRSLSAANAMQKYYRFRSASQYLHGTVSKWASLSGQGHTFQVRILDDRVSKSPATPDQFVTCELAIKHDGKCAVSQKGLLRIEIEQAWEKTADSTDTHKRVSFAELSTQTPQVTDRSPRLHHNLSLCKDLCGMFQTATSTNSTRSCVGSWENPDARWFAVPSTSPVAESSQSLAELLRWVSKEPVLRSLRPLHRISLALDVAEGILQFYSTPWLRTNNLSSNITGVGLLSPLTDTAERSRLYFVSSLGGLGAEGDPWLSRYSDHCIADAELPEVSNMLLFSFGLVLLELGFGLPWNKLKESFAREEPEVASQKSTMKIAMRLARKVAVHMGDEYSTVTRMCLRCDFGIGETDLEDEGLQSRFLEDVVVFLQRLLNRGVKWSSA